MATGQVGFKDNKMVKRVYVQQRENAIINRLNKTREEKHPDLRAEKAEREKDIRRRERMAAQDKVCGAPSVSSTTLYRERDADGYAICRSSKTGRKWKSMRSRSGRRTICTTICIRKTTWRCPAIRIVMRTSWTTSCRQLGGQPSPESRQVGGRCLNENDRVDRSQVNDSAAARLSASLPVSLNVNQGRRPLLISIEVDCRRRRGRLSHTMSTDVLDRCLVTRGEQQWQ